MSRIHACAAVAAFLLSASLTPAMAGTKVFDVPDVISSYAKTFCGDGSIAGDAITSDWVTAAFSYTNKNGKVKLFSVPGSTYTSPQACYQGRLMGQTIVNDVRQGFAVLSDGSVQLVSPTDGDWASVSGTNSSGALVGFYYPTDKGGSLASGFVWKDGVFTRYEVASYTDTSIVQITEDGTLLGNRSQGNPLRTTGFIDHQGVVEEIRVPSSYNTFVTGMNADGQVVGYYNQFGTSNRGFVMKNGNYKVFSLTSTGDTYSMGIDNESRVVGYFINTTDWSSHNFIGKVGQLVSP